MPFILPKTHTDSQTWVYACKSFKIGVFLGCYLESVDFNEESSLPMSILQPVHIHLLLNHAPIFLFAVGLVVLLLNAFFKSTAIHRLCLGMLIVGAVSLLPVYFSGEGAEEAVENISTVYENMIENHEHAAKTTLWLIEITGLLALLALVFNFKAPKMEKVFVPIVVVLAIASMASIVTTAGLGGKIRHTEIREEGAVVPSSVVETEKEKNEEEKPVLAHVPSAAPVDED